MESAFASTVGGNFGRSHSNDCKRRMYGRMADGVDGKLKVR